MLKITYHIEVWLDEERTIGDYADQTFYINDKDFKLENCVDNVAEVYADGHELDFILKHFRNIPHTFKYCRWRGDLAKFIVLNFAGRL